MRASGDQHSVALARPCRVAARAAARGDRAKERPVRLLAARRRETPEAAAVAEGDGGIDREDESVWRRNTWNCGSRGAVMRWPDWARPRWARVEWRKFIERARGLRDGVTGLGVLGLSRHGRTSLWLGRGAIPGNCTEQQVGDKEKSSRRGEKPAARCLTAEGSAGLFRW